MPTDKNKNLTDKVKEIKVTDSNQFLARKLLLQQIKDSKDSKNSIKKNANGGEIKPVKARFGDFMNTFIADDTRSVAGKSGGADSGTAGEMRSKLGKSDVVEKKKIKNYIKKKVEQTKTVIKKTKEAAKKTGTILATPIKKFHELAEENVRKNGPVRIYKPRTMNKGGGMDMGKKEEPTQWITKKEKPTQWITKKEKPKKWITKKSRGGGMDMGKMPNTVKPEPRGNPGIVENVVGKGGDYIKDLID